MAFRSAIYQCSPAAIESRRKSIVSMALVVSAVVTSTRAHAVHRCRVPHSTYPKKCVRCEASPCLMLGTRLGRYPVALLVLLTGAAPAGVVAPNLLAVHARARHRCLLASVLPQHLLTACAHAGTHRRSCRNGHGRIRNRHVEDGMRHSVANVLEKLLPHVVGFALIGNQ